VKGRASDCEGLRTAGYLIPAQGTPGMVLAPKIRGRLKRARKLAVYILAAPAGEMWAVLGSASL